MPPCCAGVSGMGNRTCQRCITCAQVVRFAHSDHAARGRLAKYVRLHRDNTVTLEQATAFVCTYGIVLESGKGPAPSLVEFIAGEPIRGSWWSHPRAKEIFQLTRALRDSEAILVCRLIAGKVTFIHQRLWPSLLRVGSQFPSGALAKLQEQHMASGQHTIVETPFPNWASAEVSAQARLLTERAAWATIRSSAPGAFGAA